MQSSKRHLLIAASALGLGITGLARAHSNEHHAKKSGPVVKEQKDWGIAGDAKSVRRTIEVRMGDNMRFTPDRIDVRRGETLRFRVQNAGKEMHEFVIGTKAENAKHAELMIKFPNMEHDEPNKVTIAPGQQGEIVWQFTKAGTVNFACLVPGHYEAGMKGKVQVSKK